MYNDGLVVKSATGLQQKYYKEKAALSKQTVTTWWDENFLTSSATSELKKMMGNTVFKNPKNTNLLKRIVELWTENEDLILDYHAGSATTAHAVLELNKEDKGNRQFILCEQMDYIETVTCPRVLKVIEANKIGLLKRGLMGLFFYGDNSPYGWFDLPLSSEERGPGGEVIYSSND